VKSLPAIPLLTIALLLGLAPVGTQQRTLRQTWQVYVPDGAGFYTFAGRSALVKVQYVDPTTGLTVRLEKAVTNTAVAAFDLPASLDVAYAWAKDETLGLCWTWPGEGYSYKNGTLYEGAPWPLFYFYGRAHKGSDIFYLYLEPCDESRHAAHSTVEAAGAPPQFAGETAGEGGGR
jgi:hypothetical protein